MSYHHCPIEPSDWSDGPDDNSCEHCGGTGEPDADSLGETSCPKCHGKGYIEYEPMDDDVL